MRDDLRDAFKKVIAREQVADQERRRAAEVRQDFEDEFRRVRDQIIVPTLNEIGNLLQEAGWTCNIVSISPSSSDASLKFEVYRGVMMAGGETRPYIAFSSLPAHFKLQIIWYTRQSHGGEEYSLDQVSNDFVAQQVLPFFDQLVADWDRFSSEFPHRGFVWVILGDFECCLVLLLRCGHVGNASSALSTCPQQS